MLYLANILLILPYVVCVYGRYAVEMGLSSVLLVLVWCGKGNSILAGGEGGRSQAGDCKNFKKT